MSQAAPEMMRLTHSDHLLRELAAMQHGQRAAISPCSTSYSITSSAVARSLRASLISSPDAAIIRSDGHRNRNCGFNPRLPTLV
jgi:hypothetical protein